MNNRYRSEVSATAHGKTSGLTEAGAISKQTTTIFDKMCLNPVEEMPPRELRLREHASQDVVARYLNLTTSLVSQWERGHERPRGASPKLL